MRINRLEDRLGKTRELRVELQLHSRGQKRKAFQQTLYKRIGADLLRITIQRQPARDLWEVPRKLRSRFPQMLEFNIVEIQQAAIHDR